jgi:hypothetical protein
MSDENIGYLCSSRSEIDVEREDTDIENDIEDSDLGESD